MDNLKSRIKMLAKEAADYSRQGVDTLPHDFKKGKELMYKAYESSKRCQELVAEFNRQEQMGG